jgi:hypothetical protein
MLQPWSSRSHAEYTDRKWREDAMTEPVARQRSYDDSLEESVEDILAAARPLPSGDAMVIEDLTEEEERLFFEALRDA